MLFENSVSPIVLIEPSGNILLYNESFCKILKKIGSPLKKNLGPLLAELFTEPEKLSENVKQSFLNEEIATGEYKLLSSNKESLWVQLVVTSILSEELKEYYQITLHDVSKRKQELELMSLRANQDQLTSLNNRHACEMHINSLINDNTTFSIIMMDLNEFKQVNDIYGHNAGDKILIYIGGQIKNCLRISDFASRWGGDEFVLVLNAVDRKAIEQIAENLYEKITIPYYGLAFERTSLLSEHNDLITASERIWRLGGGL